MQLALPSLQPLGEYAIAWAASLPADVAAIIADEEHFGLALVHAADRRMRGSAFFAIPFLADLRTAYVRRNALGLLAGGTLAMQRAGLEQLAGQSRMSDFIAATPALQRPGGTLRALYDFVLSADGVVVRSLAELDRLRDAIPGAGLQRIAVLTGACRLPFEVVAVDAGHTRVVVWAPHLDAAALGVEVFALVMGGRPAGIVCKSGRLEGVGIEFTRPADAAALFADARVVIVADPSDPAPAVAFATRGLRVVAAFASGAAEQLDGVIEYDPCHIGALLDAVDTAWSAPAPSLRPIDDPRRAPRCIIPEDARASVARQLAITAWHVETSYDLRRDAFDRIAGQCVRLSPLGPLDPQTPARALHSGAALRFESWREARRAREILKLRSNQIAVRCAAEHDVPTALEPHLERDRIVIWAPNRGARDLATFVMALHYEKRPLILVCSGGGGDLGASNVRTVAPAAAAPELARALVCVDADTQSPTAALALARLGIPLAVASTSGADEWLDNVAVYDFWDHVSIFNAVAVAKIAPRALLARRLNASQLADRLRAYRDDYATDGPLVSVVVLTRNRRTFLTRAIDSIARQTYRNIETLVVRNGGVRIDDIVSGLPNGRVLNFEENLGVNGGFNAGTRAARGKYIAYLADDDSYMPDHIGRVVAALERTRSAFAHGGMLAVHLTPDGQGGYDATGYGVACERPAEPGFLRAMNAVATPAMLMDRELLARTGNWIDELGPMADYELVMRFLLEDELVYVNRPLVVQTYRRDASQYSATTNPDMPNILRGVYARHPLPDEPWVERTRSEWLANFTRHAATQSTTPLWYPQPTVTFTAQPYSAADITAVGAVP